MINRNTFNVKQELKLNENIATWLDDIGNVGYFHCKMYKHNIKICR